MSAFRPLIRFTAAAAGLALALAAHGKPPVSAKEEKKPSPPPAKTSTADEVGAESFLRWLLLQNGGPDAISVGWPELIRVTAGKQTIPLDPANATDAALVTKLGATLDGILPRLNRADGTSRSTTPLTSAEVTARITEALRTALSATPSTTVANLSDAALSDPTYPDLRCVDAASGKTYYFSVVIYPTGGREGTLRALMYRAAEGSKRITTDGSCLLVAIEHNGKAGTELAFLNWELIDLAKVSVRCAVGFEADENALHQPGAVVTDGRKGRD